MGAPADTGGSAGLKDVSIDLECPSSNDLSNSETVTEVQIYATVIGAPGSSVCPELTASMVQAAAEAAVAQAIAQCEGPGITYGCKDDCSLQETPLTCVADDEVQIYTSEAILRLDVAYTDCLVHAVATATGSGAVSCLSPAEPEPK